MAVVGLVAVLVIAGGASRKSSTETGGGSATVAAPATPTASPPAIIAVDALPGLLLDQATINRLVGASDMGMEPGDPALPYTAGPIDHPECAGIWHPAERTTLQGSGWVALQANSFREHVGAWNHLAAQAVVAYPNAEAAAAFAGSQATTWTKCSGRLLTETPKDSAPNLWTVGPVTNREGMLSVRFMQEGTGGWGCQRAQTVRNNVVIDVRTCGFFPTDQASVIASTIRLRHHAEANMTAATPRLAPAVIPRIDGSARGLRNNVCICNPPTDKPQPARMAVQALGSRIRSIINCQVWLSDEDENKTLKISISGIFMDPSEMSSSRASTSNKNRPAKRTF